MKRDLKKREAAIATTYPLKSRSVAVVVPVYADFESVQHVSGKSCCPQSQASGHHRIILINDATPESAHCRIPRTICESTRPSCCSKNNANLGFVGSVNRALDRLRRRRCRSCSTPIPSCREISLRGWPRPLRRRRILARSRRCRTTARKRAFRLPISPIQWAPMMMSWRLTRLQRRSMRGGSSTYPIGTGFCLLITRECLDAVGFLSEDYYRGYVEDVDFCLHARAKGFRNVCAPSDLCRPRRKQIIWSGKTGVGGSQLCGVGSPVSRLIRQKRPPLILLIRLRQSRQAIERAMQPSGKASAIVADGIGHYGRARPRSAPGKSHAGKAGTIIGNDLTGALRGDRAKGQNIRSRRRHSAIVAIRLKARERERCDGRLRAGDGPLCDRDYRSGSLAISSRRRCS